MPIYLQPVEVPERCFLHEVLLWVAFQRLPVSLYDSDGLEVHDQEDGEYSPDVGLTEISDDECQRAGIPPDPNYAALFDDALVPNGTVYDHLLSREGLDPELRGELIKKQNAARSFQANYRLWRSHYQRAIEYPVSQIFVALRSGTLQAFGRLALDGVGDDVPPQSSIRIPTAFWTLKGMDFEQSAARNEEHQYKHITVPTADMLTLFPGERAPVSGVQRAGDCFVLADTAEARRIPAGRGRPPYPWDAFHLEVAALLRADGLPDEKGSGDPALSNVVRAGIEASPESCGDRREAQALLREVR